MKCLLSAIGLLAGGFVAGWCFKGMLSATGPVSAEASRGAESSEALGPTSPRNQVTLSDQVSPVREAVATPSPDATAARSAELAPKLGEAFAGLERLLFTHPHYAGHDSEFLQKYEGCSMEEMRAALFILDRHEASARSEIVAQRMKDGMFTTQVVPEGQQLPDALGSSDGLPVAVGWEAEPSSGFVTYKVTQIPPEEYPEYRDLQVEAWWLTTHLAHLGMPLDELK